VITKKTKVLEFYQGEEIIGVVVHYNKDDTIKKIGGWIPPRRSTLNE
jgi:hypothetical protein